MADDLNPWRRIRKTGPEFGKISLALRNGHVTTKPSVGCDALIATPIREIATTLAPWPN
jgi:hypothetical protein